jgi:hypothetical protein
MKKLVIAMIVFCIFQNASAQTTATEAKVDYNKSKKVAAVIELPYPPEIVEEAIRDHLTSKGNKADKSKGFYLFRGTKLRDEDLSASDVYFKVERKSRREKDVSVVYLITGNPNENITAAGNERHKIEEGKAFLNGIAPVVESHNHNRNIANQEESVRKLEKKSKKLQEDQLELEKRIRELQNKLEGNKLEQEKQTEEIEKQKAILESMRAKSKV